MYTGGASSEQKGQAAEMRNTPGMPTELRQAANQIVHSGDTAGKYATTPNPFRDPTNSYDSNAQNVLNQMKQYK